jgi:hypothetical protein
MASPQSYARTGIQFFAAKTTSIGVPASFASRVETRTQHNSPAVPSAARSIRLSGNFEPRARDEPQRTPSRTERDRAVKLAPTTLVSALVQCLGDLTGAARVGAAAQS